MSSRREFLRNCGLISAGTALFGIGTFEAFASPMSSESFADAAKKAEPLTGIKFPIRDLEARTDSQMSYVIVGCGNRGTVYSRYAERYPSKVKIVGLSDINDYRLKKMGDKFGISEDKRFGDFHEIMNAPKLADAMVISLPDDLHYEACMLALAKGYHVLLEKPMARSEKECMDLLNQSRKYNRIVAICHVLRYAPYFIALREVCRSGMIGDILNIQHLEPIAYDHIAHSYVRGNWHSSKQTTPIILAKSCHDLDIIRWVIDKKCVSASADGGLYFFKPENAPAGATMRCTDGCPLESKCAFSALRHYGKWKKRINVLDLDRSASYEQIVEKLKTSDYGKCVFHCDNDQCDNYVADFKFENGTTASFTMQGLAKYGGRRTRVSGTKGYIEGDGEQFIVQDYLTGKEKVWNMQVEEIPEYKDSGHGGGDLALFRDFVEAVSAGDASKLTSTIEASVESHIMGFRCEKSRLSHKKVAVDVK